MPKGKSALKDRSSGASGMAHQIKTLVNKPDNLGSALKVHLEVGEDTFTSIPTPRYKVMLSH